MPVTRPSITKGRISVPDLGVGRTFMFNPNDVSDTKGISWGSIEVPGASHPVYQFGTGGERVISFELYMDGDRGRVGERVNITEKPSLGRGVNFTRGVLYENVTTKTSSRNGDSLSIMNELHWYRALIYPAAYGGDYKDVAPPVCLFTFGELYQNMACIVRKADWKINYWTPTLEPVRATISIQLAEVSEKSQISEDIRRVAGVNF